jgi:membrane-associated phospholipid phosphatase
VKAKAVFYWLVGLLIVAVAIAAAFYWDNSVVAFMTTHQSPLMSDLMRDVSRFGDWPEHFLLGLALFLVALWRGNKKWARVFLSMLIALSIAGLVGRALKVTTGRARPSVKVEQRWNGPKWGHKYHSFPSGHVDASMGFFGVLFLARRRLGIACLPIPILIGFSRIYLSAHYLSDVVCAAVLGILSALVVWHFASRKTRAAS